MRRLTHAFAVAGEIRATRPPGADPRLHRLREPLARHHAVQLGHHAALDPFGMVLRDVVMRLVVAEYDLGQALGLDVRAPLPAVRVLHDDHVAALAALVEEAACRGAGLRGCDDFDDVSAEGDQDVFEAPFRYGGVTEDDGGVEDGCLEGGQGVMGREQYDGSLV